MRAPVYRHLGTRGGLLGLTVAEWGPVLLVLWLGMACRHPNVGVVLAAAVYAALRAAAQGRPEGFLEHVTLWAIRRRFTGGRLSAAARGWAPRFPFAPYACGKGTAASRRESRS
jgi:hypothetical protein